jgi:hypothetical protein
MILVAIVGSMMWTATSQMNPSSSGGTPSFDIGRSLSGLMSMLKDSVASGGGLPQVQSSSVGLLADTFTGNSTIPPTCSSSPRNSFIALTNTGSANGTAESVTITYGGEKNAFAISGPCKIGPFGSPSATTYILFGGPSKLPKSLAPVPGLPYLGTVTLSGGAQLSFTGNWFQGYPNVSTMGVALPAADFAEGKPTNSTCSTTPATGGAHVTVVNAGTVGASVTQVAISWKNATNTFTISGPCTIGPDGTPSAVTNILFGPDSKLSAAPEAGQPFAGTLTLSTGEEIQFKGIFQ